MGDVFHKCESENAVFRVLERNGTYPANQTFRAGFDGAPATIGGDGILAAGVCDYLGLAGHPRINDAAISAVRTYGTSTAARLLQGNIDLHEDLEERLAHFLGCEAAMVTGSGYMASLSLSTLFGADETVYADKHNHASLVDALRLSPAKVRRYRHNDIEALTRALRSESEGEDAADSGERAGRAVVTDGAFSMSGDVCALPDIVALARRVGLRVVVDSSHDIGVLGADGSGVAGYFGLEQVDLVVSSLSKAFAATGGVVAGPRHVIDHLRHVASSAVFTVAQPPASAAAALAALEIATEEPWRREVSLANAAALRSGLRERGHAVRDAPAPIICIPVPGAERCARYSNALLEEGVAVGAALPPAVPPGHEGLRFCSSAAFTEQDIDRVLKAFTAVDARLGPPPEHG